MSMVEEWYYVEGNERIGPIDESSLESLIRSGKLKEENFVWKKGYDNWKKISEVNELHVYLDSEVKIEAESLPSLPSETGIDWENLSLDEKMFTIKVGRDRGSSEEVEYGPYSLNVLKKAFDENRVNGKTYVFVKGLANWMFLADLPVFEKVFSSDVPEIKEEDRRKHVRKPFVARVFFHDDETFFEGICRDISVGGLQLLVGEFPGSVGDKISLNVHPDNSDYNFTASARIVRKLEGNQGVSLRFDALSDEASKSISSYITQSS